MPITPAELARRAEVTVRHIQKLCQDGVLQCSKPGGRDWLIDDASAEEYLISPRRIRKRILTK